MSNFYFCDKCDKPTDLIFNELTLQMICKYCHDTNWHAEIDKGTHYEQVRESKIHPGSTHRVGDIEKLNRKE